LNLKIELKDDKVIKLTWFVYESLFWLLSVGRDDNGWFVAGEANLPGDPWGLNPGLKVPI